MRTLLFDIDGTLLLTHQGGSTALELALQHEFALENPSIEVSFAGRTDRSLLAELLQINGLPDDEPNRLRLQNRYTELFSGVLDEVGGVVLPGVEALLARLHTIPDIHVCAMTGNLIETGQQKLAHFGLDRYFKWLVGGDHDIQRNDLAKRALQIVDQRHNCTESITVIGDTPDDIRCAQAINADVLAVCTGSFSQQELAPHQPTYLLEDLSDVEQVAKLLSSPVES